MFACGSLSINKYCIDKSRQGFTLAEILLTLLVIGIVVSLMIPSLINNVTNNQVNIQVKAASSIINQALKRARLDNSNVPIMCYYHQKNPYGPAKCNTYNENGDCSQWTFLDGSPLPSDYNGYFSECNKLLPSMRNHMAVSRVCAPGRAIADGCIPQYKGNDQVMRDNNSSNTMYTDYNANMATAGCGGWRTASFANKEAIVLNDGMTIIPYSNQFSQSPIIGIDVNGLTKPNKAGHDLFFFTTYGNAGNSSYYPGGCEYIESGGRSTATVLRL